MYSTVTSCVRLQSTINTNLCDQCHLNRRYFQVRHFFRIRSGQQRLSLKRRGFQECYYINWEILQSESHTLALISIIALKLYSVLVFMMIFNGFVSLGYENIKIYRRKHFIMPRNLMHFLASSLTIYAYLGTDIICDSNNILLVSVTEIWFLKDVTDHKSFPPNVAYEIYTLRLSKTS